MSDIKVQPRELRASAAAARSIEADFGRPGEAAVGTASSTAGQLLGWSMSDAPQRLAGGWAPALTALRKRLADAATDLDTTAQGYEQTEHAVAGALQGQAPR